MVRRNDTNEERISHPLPDDGWHRPRSSAGRFFATLGKTLGWVIFAVIALVASAWLHVFTPLARQVVRDVAVHQVNRSIVGRVEIGHLYEIDYGRLAATELSVYDAEGRRVLFLDDVIVEPDMAAIVFEGTIHFDSIQANDGYLALIETPEGPPSIATAFQAPEPRPDETQPGPAVELEEIRVRGLRVTATYEQVRDLTLSDVHLRGDLSFEDEVFQGTIASAGFIVMRNDRPVGALESLRGAYDGAGGEAEVHARLRAGDGKVWIDGTAELPEEAGDPPIVHATLRLDAIGPSDIRALGFDPAKLTSELSGKVTFDGTPETFEASMELDTEGGSLVAEATMRDGDSVEAEVETAGLYPGRVWAGLAVPRVSGSISVKATGVSHPDDVQVSARVASLAVGEWRLPSAELDAHVRGEEVRIERLDLPYLRGDVDVRGTVGFDGSANLHVAASIPNLRAEPNVRRLLPDVAGGLDAEVDLALEPGPAGAPPRIAASGEAALRNGRIGALRAERLRVRGTARGSASAPIVDLTVSGASVEIGDRVQLRQADLALEGGPRLYELTGTVVGPEGQRAGVQGEITKLAQGFEIDARGTGENVLGRSWGFTAEDVHVKPGGTVEIGSAELRSGEMALHVSGTYRARGESSLETRIESVDAQMIADLLGIAPLEGRIEGRLSFSGSTRRPEIDAMLWYTGGSLRGVYVDDAALVLDLSTREGRLDGQLEMDLGTHGAIAAKVQASFDAGRRRAFVDAVRDGTFDATVETRDLALRLIHDLRPDAPRLHGRIDGEIVARGTVRDPDVTVDLRGTELSLDGSVPLDARLEGSYADARARLALVADDAKGRLGEVEVAADVDVPAIVRDPSIAPRLAETQPWQVSIRTAPRRLDELPRPLRVDVPARAVLTAHAIHRPGRPLEGDADVGLTWLGRTESCGRAATPRARARARFAEGRAEVEMVGRLGSTQVLGATASAAAPIDAWITDGPPTTLPEVDGRIVLSEMTLQEVPVLCDGMMGRLSGAIDVERLFGDAPTIRGALRGDGIRYGDAPSSELDVVLNVDRARAEALVRMIDTTGGGIEADARVPLRWENGVPALARGGQLQASVDMERFHIEPLSVIPALAFAEGTMNGRVAVEGSIQAPTFDGFVELSDVAFGIVQPAQRFEEGTGRIVFHRSWIELQRIHFHDLGGTIRVSGGIGLDGLVPNRVRLGVYTNDLPIRNEGMPIGELTAQANVRARISERKAEVWIRTQDMTIEVERQLRTNIQQLEPHPDIVLVRNGEPIATEGEEAPQMMPMDVVVHVDATDPFWVRREDFAVQLTANLDVETSGQDVSVGGAVEFRRGWLELLGKRFELEEGTVEFLGGTEINPRIDLMMSHELDARPGDQVFVRVVGHLQQPELEFSSTIPGVTTAGEVLALLAGGGAGAAGSGATESSASEQATSFLAGVTAGVLTLTARRELGDVFPDISVEATDRGARLRAGFDAERLIPSFLEGIVRGAYIEGFVVAEGGEDEQAAANSDALGGISLELIFPRSIVATAEIQPPAAWSVDVMYEP